MPEDIELNVVEFITIDTIGPPGQRVFHLQAQKDDSLVTIILEKFQASAIAENINRLLEELSNDLELVTPDSASGDYDFDLLEPIIPLFRAGQIGLGYDQEHDLVIIVIGELVADDIVEDMRRVRFGITRPHVKALAIRTDQVVQQGRPVCGNCGKLIDPDGHFCVKSNGHRKPVSYA